MFALRIWKGSDKVKSAQVSSVTLASFGFCEVVRKSYLLRAQGLAHAGRAQSRLPQSPILNASAPAKFWRKRLSCWQMTRSKCGRYSFLLNLAVESLRLGTTSFFAHCRLESELLGSWEDLGLPFCMLILPALARSVCVREHHKNRSPWFGLWSMADRHPQKKLILHLVSNCIHTWTTTSWRRNWKTK